MTLVRQSKHVGPGHRQRNKSTPSKRIVLRILQNVDQLQKLTKSDGQLPQLPLH